MRFEVVSKKGIKTRVTSFEHYLVIDNMFFTDKKILQEGIPVPFVQRKWKDKWFVKNSAFIPNAHIVKVFDMLVVQKDKEFQKDIFDWLVTIVKQDQAKNKQQ